MVFNKKFLSLFIYASFFLSSYNISPNSLLLNKKENSVEENFAKKAVKQFIEAAKFNGILEDSNIIEFTSKDGKNVINNIYKIRVAMQKDCSCGPRAMYNCQAMSEIITFDDERKSFFINPDKMNYLNKVIEKDGEKKHPRLAEFFKKMHDACEISFGYNSSEYFYYIDKIAWYNEINGKIIGLSADGKSVTGLKNKERKIFSRKFGKDGAPQWALYPEMIEFMKYCNKEQNGKFKFDKIGFYWKYEFWLFESEYRFQEMKLYNKGIGCRRNFVININGNHYVSVNVIKTGENEYDWFVSDSYYSWIIKDSNIKNCIKAMVMAV